LKIVVDCNAGFGGQVDEWKGVKAVLKDSPARVKKLNLPYN
jgi:hypothetical protein